MSKTVKEKWEMIGHKLELSSEVLSSIGQKQTSSRQRLFAVISAWLHRKGSQLIHNPITLRTLVRVLESAEVDENCLAEEITKLKDKGGIIISYACVAIII